MTKVGLDAIGKSTTLGNPTRAKLYYNLQPSELTFSADSPFLVQEGLSVQSRKNPRRHDPQGPHALVQRGVTLQQGWTHAFLPAIIENSLPDTLLSHAETGG